jgi:hypothetical protein
MTGDDDLRTPAPADVWQRIDLPLINQRFTELILADRPDLMGPMMDGALVIHVEPFDDEGWTTVRVVTKDGADTEAGAQAHWSALI